MTQAVIPKELREFEGFSPLASVQKLFRVPVDRLLAHYAKTANSSKIEESFWIPDICQRPQGVWRGLERMGQEQAYCYSGIPDGTFANQHYAGKLDLPHGLVFVVYTDPDLTITDWSLVRGSPDRGGFPIDHGSRFGELLWPTD